MHPALKFTYSSLPARDDPPKDMEDHSQLTDADKLF